MPYRPYNMFFGDDAYCYYAVVTKNCDTEKKEHINEIEIQAIPYTTDYTEKGPGAGSDAGKMWVPCVSSIVGVHSYKKDDNDELPGYGVHSLPEVGSIVVVLAMRSDRASNYNHVVLGNFWNREVMIPKLSPIFYKPGGEKGKEEYNLEELTTKDGFADKIANTTYYKTKANTNVIADDFKGIYGIYRAPQEKEVDKDKFNAEDGKGRYYMMLDPKNSNIDVRVNNFTLTANMVTLYAKENFSITTAEGKTLIQTKKEGSFCSGQNGINFTGQGGLNFKADAINMNKRDPLQKKQIDLELLKMNMPEVKIIGDELVNSYSHLHCLVTTMVEINILRNEETYRNMYVNGDPGSLIRIAKDVRLYSGVRAEKTDRKPGQEFDLSLTDKEVERALYPLKLAGNKFVVDTAELVVEPDPDVVDFNPRPTDEQLRDVNAQGVKVKFDIDLWNKHHMKHIIIKRKIVFRYDPALVGPRIRLVIHNFAINGNVAPFNRYVSASQNSIANIANEADKRFKPRYDEQAEFDIEAGTTWGDLINNNNDIINYLDYKILNRAYIPYYVDMDATLTRNDDSVTLTQATDFHDGEPGIIKFEISPYSNNDPALPAQKLSDLSFVLNNGPNDNGDIMYGANFANFNFAVNRHDEGAPDAEKHKNRIRTDGVTIVQNGTPIGDASAGDGQAPVNVYVRYNVVRYLPLILACRGLSDIDQNNGHDNAYLAVQTRERLRDKIYPIMTHDIYDVRSKFAIGAGAGAGGGAAGGGGAAANNANDPYYNKVWKMMSCTNAPDEYKSMLVREPVKGEAFLYLEDTSENFKNITKFATRTPSVYRKNAGADEVMKWDGDPDNMDVHFKIAEEFKNGQQHQEAQKKAAVKLTDKKGKNIPPPPPAPPRLQNGRRPDDDEYENICGDVGVDVQEYERGNA